MNSVIQWFKGIKDKDKLSFIQFDIDNFYPSISKKLLLDALKWAEKFVKIEESDKQIILQAKQTFLFNDGTAWCKKGDHLFDVTMGSYDGAETSELVGLYLLSQIQMSNTNTGIYRDDGLLVTRSTPRQSQNLPSN